MALEVMAQWLEFNPLTGRFEPDNLTPTSLPVRETKKLLHVTFPSGWIRRTKKYNRLGKPVGIARECFGNGKMFKLCWNPQDYTIKGE